MLIGPSKIIKKLSSATKAVSLTGAEAKAVGAVANGATQHTKSSLKRGQEMHKEYMKEQALADPSNYLKEHRLSNGLRPDVIDIKEKTIRELKPNNPRAIREGYKQLEKYKDAMKDDPFFKGIDWNTHLDTY